VGSTAFPNLQIQPLTFSGDVRFAYIAPDGRFAAFVRDDSVWVRQISPAAGGRDIQLAPKVAGRTYQHPTISPNGDHVDFVMVEGGIRELWRVPLLGGSPQKVAEDVWSAVGWSPDGRSMAFMRFNEERLVTSMIKANSDGSDQQVIARREFPLMFLGAYQPGSPTSRPSWSLDGTQVMVPGYAFSGEGREPVGQLVFVKLNRTGFVGGLIPREDGAHGTTQQVRPGVA
jgi:hypothetical protein